MRTLFLCVATFLGGLLVGALFWPEEYASRPSGRETVRDVTVRETPATYDDRSFERGVPGSEGDAADVPSADTPLRELAGDATVALDRALSSAAASAYLAGDGEITGVVRDPEGRPVVGVIVTATPEAKPFDIALAERRVRERPHENRPLDDAARAAIEGELWRRHVRVTARTGSDGRYTLEGLGKARHNVAAFHEDYALKPASNANRVTPDATVDFTAQPVVAVPVEVRLPEGDAPGYAWVSWRGPNGSGWETWRPDPGEIRLPVGTCTLKAQTWLPEPMQSEEVERTVSAGDADGAAVVLQLAGRRILTARLVLPGGLDMPESVDFRLRKLEGTDDVDPATLRAGESQRGARNRGAGRAIWADLEPGRYLIAAFLGGKRLLGHTVAELGDSSLDVDVPGDLPTEGAYLKVALLAPGGGPVPGKPRFHVIAAPGAKVRYREAEAIRQTDGTWLVFVPDEMAELSEADLRVRVPEYGSAQERFLPRNPGSVRIRFDKPARLALRVERIAGSGVEGRLFAGLVDDKGVAAQRKIEPDGTVDLSGVQPGSYSLLLFVRAGSQRWPILRRQLLLRAGDDEQTVAVPPLHTLRVRPNPRLRARRITLRSNDPEIGPLVQRQSVRNGVATFPTLAAGAYELEVGRKKVKTRVPGPPELRVD